MLEDFRIACMFLTRLPLRPTRPVGLRDLAAAVYMFPIVGALVGAVGGLVYLLAIHLDLPTLPATVLAVAAMVAVTGGLHEDGLADTADALGAGEDREKALAVMRDSRIGSFGALALVLVVVARLSALANFWDPGFFLRVAVTAAAASRAAMPVVMWLQPSARTSGLAASAGRPEPPRVWAGIALALALGFLLLPPAAFFEAAAASALAAAATATWLGRRFGGCTGDTLGAVQQVAEVAFLLAVVTEI
ncbi:Adenosylcobinamide-GDP ribazoletransferase [bacterium HR40]|nr:Adenosylcobinamide-GDP ribazoletransferase [bacterium HR40]